MCIRDSIVTELPSQIWNAIVGAVTKVATWGTNMKAKAVEGIKNVCLLYTSRCV